MTARPVCTRNVGPDPAGSPCPECGHIGWAHFRFDEFRRGSGMTPVPCTVCQELASTVPTQAIAAILEADAAETHTRTVEARLVRVRLALSQLLDDAELHPDAKENRR